MNLIPVSSVDIKELECYRALSEVQLKRYFEPHGGLFIAETPMIIERALAFGCEPVSFLVEDKKLYSGGRELLRKVVSGHGDVPIYTAPLEVLTKLIGFELTRGVLCLMKRPEEKKAEELLKTPGLRRIAVMEKVMNPTNLGAIMRSAAALRVDLVLLSDGCTDPLYRRCARVSMGTVFQIPWAYLPEGSYLELLRENGFKTVAMALAEDAIPLDDPVLKKEEKLAIILGTEGDGLDMSTQTESDYKVIIPMQHGVDSLNVAAAAAVAFWELTK